MGNARWNPSDWAQQSAKAQTQTRQQIFTQRGMHDDMNPRNIKVRESVDSAANPASTPIMIFSDHTGSMGALAEIIAKTGLGTVIEELYSRKPVSDPHVLVGVVGDAYSDQAPLQASQFEASTVLVDQLKNLYLEANGGGNGGESYLLAWYFAAMKTKCDSLIKRGKKGYLFTIGDEAPHMTLTREQISHIFGDNVEKDFTAQELLSIASQGWEVFHLIVQEATHQQAYAKWKSLLGERAIKVDDHEKLAEIIVSTIQVLEGADVTAVADSWSGDTSIVVAKALGGLAKSNAAAGVIRL